MHLRRLRSPDLRRDDDHPLGYDAQYTSSDTGLIYLRARVYDPATAQFVTVDPLSRDTSMLLGVLASWLRRRPLTNRLTSCLSSSVRRAVPSSCRRSSSSESRSASKTSVSELTGRAIASLRSTSSVGEELPAS